jgi:hypothetical protein
MPPSRSRSLACLVAGLAAFYTAQDIKNDKKTQNLKNKE